MIADMNERHGCSVSGMDEILLARLMGYKWPGNVRELRNTMERAIILAGSGRLGVEHLPAHFGEPGFAPAPTGRTVLQPGGVSIPVLSDTAVHVEVGTTVDEAERQLILKTLELHAQQQNTGCGDPGHQHQDASE